MIDKLQHTYNQLIHQSNLQWAISKNEGKDWDGKRDMLQTLAYGFQEAAAMLLQDFPALKYRETHREKEIREHHLQEEESIEPKEKVEQE